MTTLHLIRHGRASALEADYDRLQPEGEEQARQLGAHYAAGKQRFDAVYVGPLRRQLETLRLMREAAGDTGAAWPEASVLPGLEEGPFEIVMRHHVRPRLPHDSALQAIASEIRGARDTAVRDAALARLFDYMVELWRKGEVAAEGLETSIAFDARVDAALQTIAAEQVEGAQVAVVTSNGVIGRLLSVAGQSVAPGTSRHRVYNGSVSRLERSGDHWLVRAHNVVEHLRDPKLLTAL